MEIPVKVSVAFDIEYEVSSPCDDTLDSDRIGAVSLCRWESVWMTKEGLMEGFLTSGQTRLYPHFTDTDRRTLFASFNQGTPGSQPTYLTWGGATTKWELAQILLLTDDGWTNPLVIETGIDGGWWFAVEGELETDYRIWKKGVPGTVTL